ncbi:MAG: hypothetical protein U5N26_10635 [Candidatus Marinimicrobia bacterium]|nr:hypothetical protein [Candidatus Neomarinimicrobiota bacterium]
MKRMFLILLSAAFSLTLNAYELGTESWDRFMILDPETRAMGLTYPRSWLEPSPTLLPEKYPDSSYTFARWDQLFTIDQSAGGNYRVLFRHRRQIHPLCFSPALGRGDGNDQLPEPLQPSKKDVLLRYRNKHGSLQYFHTDNTQALSLKSGNTLHHIRTRDWPSTISPPKNSGSKAVWIFT